MTNAGASHLASLSGRGRARIYPDKKSFIEHVKPLLNGRVINYFDGEEITARNFSCFFKTSKLDPIVNLVFLAERKALIRGELSVHKAFDTKIEQLRLQIEELKKDDDYGTFFALNKYGMIVEIEESIRKLEESRVYFSARPVADKVTERCLVWSETLEKQPAPVKAALVELNVNGLYCNHANGQQLSRKMARQHLDVFAGHNAELSLDTSRNVYGYSAYEYLKGKYGERLPVKLCKRGVFGIAYSDGYASFLG